jgi:acylphosphatase
MISRLCLVSGRVQGVFFRAHTRQKALTLGLSGRARNLPDGRVEVLVTGPPERVAALCEWLWEGPPMARVEGVDCETLPSPPAMRGFQLG